MSAQPLFLDLPVEFVKEAGTLTRLGDNIDTWPQEIMQEAYKRLPYLSNFEVNVVLDRLDEGRGYAFGSIEVRQKSDMPEADKAGRLSAVHIPVLLKEQMMSPLDLFLYGRRYNHLTEARLRAALFRPESFDSIQDRPPEALIGNDLQPPALTGQTYGGAGGVKLGMDGAAAAAPTAASPPPPPPPPPSAGASTAGIIQTPEAKMAGAVLLPKLHGRVNPEHFNRVKLAMRDPSVRAAYMNANEGVQAAISSALCLEVADIAKTAQLAFDSIPPDVVQMRRLPDGQYLVKWANADMYAPQEQTMQPQQAMQMAGSGPVGQQLQQQGMVTAAPTAEISAAMEAAEIRAADQFGIWLVQDALGNQVVGWVFPKILSLDMQPMPADLFNNGSQYALQSVIAGKMIGKATDIPSTAPRGYGCLFFVDKGSARAFVPMTVTGSYMDPMGTASYVAQTDMGEQVTFTFSDTVKTATRVSETQLIVPATYKWMPLKAKVDLVADPSVFMKTAARKWSSTVEIVGDGDIYTFRGPAIAKLASSETEFVDRAQAEFISTLLGLTPEFAKTALDKAAKHETAVAIEGVRVLSTAQEKYASAKRAVLDELAQLNPPIRNYFLVKEASILDDALTADKVLGLGFINAENIATFVDMLPQLEEASAKLAEMLFAVRCGMKDVPEVAVERMLIAMEDVINGLRTLRQKEIHFGE